MVFWKKLNYFMAILDINEIHQQDDKSTQKIDVNYEKKTNEQR